MFDLRAKTFCHFRRSWHNPLLNPLNSCALLSGKLSTSHLFPPPPLSPVSIPEFIPHSSPPTTTTTTQAALITADLHVCSRAVWEEMKQNSQWLPLQSFTHLTERASFWAPDTASKQMQASKRGHTHAHKHRQTQRYSPRKNLCYTVFSLNIPICRK